MNKRITRYNRYLARLGFSPEGISPSLPREGLGWVSHTSTAPNVTLCPTPSFPRRREYKNTESSEGREMLEKPVSLDSRVARGQFILSACKAVEGRE